MIERTLGLYRMVSTEELQALVAELDGRWYAWEGGCKGIIQEAGACVWAYVPYPIERYACEPEHRAIIADHATREVVGILEIGVSHDEGSQELASRLIEVMSSRWGGLEIDDEWFRSPDDEDWW